MREGYKGEANPDPVQGPRKGHSVHASRMVTRQLWIKELVTLVCGHPNPTDRRKAPGFGWGPFSFQIESCIAMRFHHVEKPFDYTTGRVYDGSMAYKHRTYLGLAAVLVGSLITVSSVQVSGATPPDPEHKVTICHRTNSDSNPYVQITVDESAVDGQKGADHYGEHKGPIWNPTLKDQKIEWGDIIPPVSPYHSGQNWSSEGQAILNRGCTVQNASTTSTTTVSTTSTTLQGATSIPKATTSVPTDVSLIPPTTIVRDGYLPRTGSALFPLAAAGITLIALGWYLLRQRNG